MSAGLVARFTLVELVFALSACTPRPATAPLRPPPVEIVETATAAASEPLVEVVVDDDAAAPDAPADVTLSLEWSTDRASGLPYAQSIGNARIRAAAEQRVLDGSDAGLGVTPAWFARLSHEAESASHDWALAYHATDASPAEKVAAILAAAEHAFALGMRLEDLGLASMPKSWRADPTLAVTFEDVASGPAQRWRDEGRALVQLCIEVAFEERVHDTSTAKCQAIRRREGTVAVRRAYARPDAGARGCRCAPGDPLCSEAPGTWCAR